jgi:ribosome-binding factor A
MLRHTAPIGRPDGERVPMGGQRGPGGPGQSQRQLRVGEAMRHVLAELLVRGAVHDPVLTDASITISEVRMSRDLRHAVAYVMALGDEPSDDLLDALHRAAPLLRGEAARRIHLKFAPQLSFRIDRSFAEATRIDRLLERERADLARAHEEDDGTV